jgi:hypothetical protein
MLTVIAKVFYHLILYAFGSKHILFYTIEVEKKYMKTALFYTNNVDRSSWEEFIASTSLQMLQSVFEA